MKQSGHSTKAEKSLRADKAQNKLIFFSFVCMQTFTRGFNHFWLNLMEKISGKKTSKGKTFRCVEKK